MQQQKQSPEQPDPSHKGRKRAFILTAHFLSLANLAIIALFVGHLTVALQITLFLIAVLLYACLLDITIENWK